VLFAYPPSDITLAQLACPLGDFMFCLHSGITISLQILHCVITPRRDNTFSVSKVTRANIGHLYSQLCVREREGEREGERMYACECFVCDPFYFCCTHIWL